MMSRKKLREPSLEPLDTLIRSALQDEVSSLELPCAWRQIKKRVWRLEREKQTRYVRQGVYYTESMLPLSVRADMSYFFITNTALQQIR